MELQLLWSPDSTQHSERHHVTVSMVQLVHHSLRSYTQSNLWQCNTKFLTSDVHSTWSCASHSTSTHHKPCKAHGRFFMRLLLRIVVELYSAVHVHNSIGTQFTRLSCLSHSFWIWNTSRLSNLLTLVSLLSLQAQRLDAIYCGNL